MGWKVKCVWKFVRIFSRRFYGELVNSEQNELSTQRLTKQIMGNLISEVRNISLIMGNVYNSLLA